MNSMFKIMNNVKQLSSLLIFAEVATQQSFTLAAKKLGMSKSAISQHVSRLEQDIGQQLLSRHTRGMALTTVGEKLLARCELLRGQVELVYDELNQSKTVPSGKFALTIPHACEEDIVLPALKQLLIEFPLLQIELHVTDDALDLIENNLDLAIYSGDLKDSNYRALPLGIANEVFCASPRYLQRNSRLTELEELTEHNVIAITWQDSPWNIYENNKLTEKYSLPLTFFCKTNTLSSALKMAVQDMGVVLLPEFVIQSSLAKGDLVRVLPQYRGRVWPFYLVHRFQGEKPIHITRFYHLLQHYFSRASNRVG
ncbi:MAG: DNA-binding transcriptional LysR family regulator [Alteromonadaceae bacterium]|jgi:DNA-binding transcriptional LysR family regulator